jgi:hypothetical protein
VLVPVRMQVGVHLSPVAVPMLVDQVNREQEVPVAQPLLEATLSYEPVLLIKNVGAVCKAVCHALAAVRCRYKAVFGLVHPAADAPTSPPLRNGAESRPSALGMGAMKRSHAYIHVNC